MVNRAIDRQRLFKHLSLVKKHIARGEKSLARQRRVVAELQRDGHDATMARNLLSTFERLQAGNIAEGDALARQLAEMPPADPAA